MDINLRTMTAEDLPAILEIERVSFPQPWSETLFRLEINNANSLCIVAESAGRLAGYFCAGVVLDEMDLRVIAVAPALRGRRIGELLMHRLLHGARDKGVAKVHLEVRESNTAAQAMYRKFGFRAVGRRKGYYEHPSEDALLYTAEP